MDNIDISFGDDVLLSHGNGVTIDDYNDNVISSETVVGPPGPPGPAGYSPTANVTQTADGAIIRITDESGTTTANVYNGTDGVSPTATVTGTASGATITITDANGTTTATINNGEDGEPGDNATIGIGQVTTLAPGSQATVSNVGTATNAVLDFGIPEGQRGIQGIQGEPGINAQAYVTQNTGSATITIEDADGTTTATVYDGQDGTNGTDGFSPVATVTQNTGSATITITDQNGTTTATVYDGTPGTVPNDGTLTIQKNGTTVQTFTANQSSNATANIVVPTQFSDLSGTAGTAQIADDSITPSKLKGYSTANTTNTWVPVSTEDNELQHRVIKAFNADGSIPKTALAGMPCPDYANVITTWGDLSTTVTETTTASGYIVGKVLIIGARQRAYIEINGIPVGGFPYNDTSQVNNLQVAFCIPVANNTEVKFYCSGTGGRFEGCKLVGWKLG